MVQYLQDPFQSIPLSIHYSPWMVWIPFALFVAVYIAISVVLYYHWISYGMKAKGILLAEFIFPLGTAVFLYMAFVSISYL